MLRHPKAVSSAKELSEGKFMEIIDDNNIPYNKTQDVKRILLCSGKIYWDLFEEMEKSKRKDTVIIRIEQLYPLKSDLLMKYISKYKNAGQCVWVQEEPQNMGAWNYLALKFMSLLPDNIKLYYVGRRESASTATGFLITHNEEQSGIIQQAFSELS